MLAEQASNTDLRLPQELRDKAQVIAGELTWTARNALIAVSWLSLDGRAVVGVELWRDLEGQPLWLAASDYSPSIHDALTPERIAWCAGKAAEFIQAHCHEPGALFNLTWDNNAE